MKTVNAPLLTRDQIRDLYTGPSVRIPEQLKGQLSETDAPSVQLLDFIHLLKSDFPGLSAADPLPEPLSFEEISQYLEALLGGYLTAEEAQRLLSGVLHRQTDFEKMWMKCGQLQALQEVAGGYKESVFEGEGIPAATPPAPAPLKKGFSAWQSGLAAAVALLLGLWGGTFFTFADREGDAAKLQRWAHTITYQSSTTRSTPVSDALNRFNQRFEKIAVDFQTLPPDTFIARVKPLRTAADSLSDAPDLTAIPVLKDYYLYTGVALLQSALRGSGGEASSYDVDHLEDALDHLNLSKTVQEARPGGGKANGDTYFYLALTHRALARHALEQIPPRSKYKKIFNP